MRPKLGDLVFVSGLTGSHVVTAVDAEKRTVNAWKLQASTHALVSETLTYSTGCSLRATGNTWSKPRVIARTMSI